MFYFIKHDHKIIVQCRLCSGGAVTATADLWQSLGGGAGGGSGVNVP